MWREKSRGSQLIVPLFLVPPDPPGSFCVMRMQNDQTDSRLSSFVDMREITVNQSPGTAFIARDNFRNATSLVDLDLLAKFISSSRTFDKCSPAEAFFALQHLMKDDRGCTFHAPNLATQSTAPEFKEDNLVTGMRKIQPTPLPPTEHNLATLATQEGKRGTQIEPNITWEEEFLQPVPIHPEIDKIHRESIKLERQLCHVHNRHDESTRQSQAKKNESLEVELNTYPFPRNQFLHSNIRTNVLTVTASDFPSHSEAAFEKLEGNCTFPVFDAKEGPSISLLKRHQRSKIVPNSLVQKLRVVPFEGLGSSSMMTCQKHRAALIQEDIRSPVSPIQSVPSLLERLSSVMARSKQSQDALQDWEYHKQGLAKSHSRTTTKSNQSRKRLQEKIKKILSGVSHTPSSGCKRRKLAL